MAGGNGNPMGLPGLPRDGVGIRQAAPVVLGLDKQSVSSASLDKTSQRRYLEGSNSNIRQGSNSIILEEEGAASPG